jgi:hypothetical protein
LNHLGPGDGESTEASRSGIIRMTFQLGTQSKKLLAAKRTAGQLVQAVHYTKPNGGAAAQSPRSRHVFSNRTGKGKRPGIRLSEEKPGGCVQYRRRSLSLGRALNLHEVVKAQRHSQAIKSGPEIGDARWDANRNY